MQFYIPLPHQDRNLAEFMAEIVLIVDHYYEGAIM